MEASTVALTVPDITSNSSHSSNMKSTIAILSCELADPNNTSTMNWSTLGSLYRMERSFLRSLRHVTNSSNDSHEIVASYSEKRQAIKKDTMYKQ